MGRDGKDISERKVFYSFIYLFINLFINFIYFWRCARSTLDIMVQIRDRAWFVRLYGR